MCNNCGNVGWTIELNAEGVEYIESCFECFVEAHEADAEEHCPEDDRGHEYEYAAHRCTHCNQLHPSVREAA